MIKIKIKEKNIIKKNPKKMNKHTTHVSLRWHGGVVVITTAQLHSTKPELKFCTG